MDDLTLRHPEEFNIPEFRELTRRVISAEKPGFWSDWSQEQQKIYMTGDWRAFSISRGYSKHEIEDFAAWMQAVDMARGLGINPFALIHDLALHAARANQARDSRSEIAKSSHLPAGPDRIDVTSEMTEADIADALGANTCSRGGP